MLVFWRTHYDQQGGDYFMAKREKNPQATPTAANTATEFASETNAAEVRRQNQASANQAATQTKNNPTE